MPFADLRHTIELGGERAGAQAARVRTEPHRAAHIRYVLLRFHERDHGVRALRRELARVAVVEPAPVARELDDRRLHAEADAEERQTGLARAPDRFDHALDAAHAEPAGDEQAVDV